jgi:hypothetical protein
MRHYVPVHEDQRRRFSRKRRVYRDMCAVLDIADLAGRGFLRPGLHPGEAEIILGELDGWAIGAPIVAAVGPDAGEIRIEVDSGRPMAGMLTMRWPDTQRIGVIREDRPCGSWWSFVCPGSRFDPVGCGRRVRLLFLPPTPPGITAYWACRLCWRLLYRDWRPQYVHAETMQNVESLAALEHDIRRLREGMLERLESP